MQTRILWRSACVILAFDTIASIASRVYGFPYSRASVGSYALYFAIGSFAARATSVKPVSTAAATAAVVGLVDASLGWAISWYLVPGTLALRPVLTVGVWCVTALFVVMFAALVGALGGLVGRRDSGGGAIAT